MKELKRRVVVTGMGAVTCYGTDVSALWQNCSAGRGGVSISSRLPGMIAAEVPAFSVDGYLDPRLAKRADRVLLFCLTAGHKALEMAQLGAEQRASLDGARCGIIVGSGVGGFESAMSGFDAVREHGIRRLSPFFIPFAITNMGPGMLAMSLQFMGPNYSVTSACATGTHAVISAAQHILRGEADLMLAGASEAGITPLLVGGLAATRQLTAHTECPERASRPFDATRDGFVIGEGAGVLVLEEYEHAKARGATIYAEYLGGALCQDPKSLVHSSADGSTVARTMALALSDAGIARERISLLSAYASGSIHADEAEMRGIETAFGSHSSLVVTAPKSLLGHSLGSSAAIEMIAAIQSLHQQTILPTINLSRTSAQFNICKKATPSALDCVLCNTMGYGGPHASLIFASVN